MFQACSVFTLVFLYFLSVDPRFYRVIKKVSVHLMITTRKVTNNDQSVHRQSPDIY